jgi:hypothetical protein
MRGTGGGGGKLLGDLERRLSVQGGLGVGG